MSRGGGSGRGGGGLDCTATCRSKQHAAQINAAIIRGTEAQAIAYIKSVCQRYCFVTDASGKTALHTAASCGKRKVVKWLISQGAALNPRDYESGYTPLHRALFYGHLHVGCTLIQSGCSMSALDHDSLTPLDHVNFDRPPKVTFKCSRPTHVYVWGSNTNYNLGQTSQQARGTPECLEIINREAQWISDVAMSKFHTVFVNVSGRVYCCGHGQGGRLGLDTNNAPVITPRPIKTFTHVNIVKAAVGPDHSLFLTDSGQVYCCGSNHHHQLGLNPPPDNVYTPRLLTWHKSHKDVAISGVGAAKYHSVMWTSKMLYTFGLNAGQLGFSKNAAEHTIVTPRNVTSIVLKEDGILTCVGVSDGATVLSTSQGDVYVLHQYQIRKVASKMPDIVKISCIGGYLDHKVGATGLKEHGGDDLKIAVLIGKNVGHLYLWTQQLSHLSHCIFSLSREVCVVDFCLSRHGVGIVTEDGEAFSGVVLPNKKEITVKPAVRKAYRPSGQLIEFPEYSSCITVRLTRLPALHRTAAIMCDPKGNNFAALQIELNSFLVDGPRVSLSTMHFDFKSFLEETDETDSVHDVVVICGNKRFPAHAYILASQSEYFRNQLLKDADHQLAENGDLEKSWRMFEENDKKCFVFPDIQPEIFKEVLTYMYSNSCPFLTSLYSSKSQVSNGVLGDEDGKKANGTCNSEPRAAYSVYKEELQVGKKKKRNRKLSGIKTVKEGKNFQSFLSLANKLHIPALKRELEIVNAFYQDSDLRNEKKDNLKLLREPYHREDHQELWDVKITSKSGDVLGAHKCVLAARLEYFRCMFTAGWIESTSSQALTIPLPTNQLTTILDYLYQDDSAMLRQCRDPEYVCNLLVAADQFLISRLHQICQKVLTDLLTLRNVADLLEFASRCNADSLKSSAMQFICLNLSTLLENGVLVSLDDYELLEELSVYYKGFVRRMCCRVMTPYDSPPYSEELEQLLEENPIVLPDSDQDWEDATFVKEDKPLTPGGGPGSARKKKRQHRNSQGDTRCRKASTSSSISSSDYDPCRDMEDDLETLSFHDLEEREPVEPPRDRAVFQSSPVDIPPFSKDLTFGGEPSTSPACPMWQKVNRKRSSSGAMSPQEPEEKEVPQSPVNRVVSPTVQPVEPVHTHKRSVETSEPLFPSLQDSVAATQKVAHSLKTSKISKLSQKQRKKLAAEAQATEAAKDVPKPVNPSNPWAATTSAWGGDKSAVCSPRTANGSHSLADIIKAEETKVKKTSQATSVKPKKPSVEHSKKNVTSPGTSWKSEKGGGSPWSIIASSPPSSPSTTFPPGLFPSSPGVRTSELNHQASVVTSPLAMPTTPSFSNILQEEETLSDNLMRERSKPLALIQMEDRAIEELLAFYGASECHEEKITVSRVKKTVLNPVWNK